MEISLAGILFPLGSWLSSALIFMLFQCNGGGVGADPQCAFVPVNVAAQIGQFYYLSMMAAVAITPVSTVVYLLLNIVCWFIKPK